MATYQHLSHGFEPVFDARSRVLVLGSFPSVLSRAHDFYYGNPHNRFWRVLAACAGAPTPETIPEKKELLLSHGVALWDVIEECDIKGSSDASIKNVVPARVERVLERAPIERVICNGATAGRLYRRYLRYKVGLDAAVLPSTSPANAAWSLDRLTERWREELGELSAAGEGDDRDGDLGSVAYAAIALRDDAPPASTFAVHRSMQGNKRKDTKPELLVRERLRQAGLSGYRLQWKVPGRPDIAWPGKKVALFINGCFWHRCPRCNLPLPKRNVEYWTLKFQRNVERDNRNLRALSEAGWTVHVVWECELKRDRIDGTLGDLLPKLARELGKELATPASVAPAAPAPPPAAPPATSVAPAPMHYLYVLECADGSWYTGYTTDVPARVTAHESGEGAKYTRAHRPVRLVAQATFATKHDAMSAEYRFKRLTRAQKEALVARAADEGLPFEAVLRDALG